VVSQKSLIISPKKFLTQKSMQENSPGTFASEIDHSLFYQYSPKALETLLIQEIDNIKNEEHESLRNSFKLPQRVMLFKAAKLEQSFENPILGPYRYPSGVHIFSEDRKLSSTFVGQFSKGLRNGVGHEIYEDGSGFHGNYIDDIQTGRGRIVSANGDYYYGDFLNGRQDGLGT